MDCEPEPAGHLPAIPAAKFQTDAVTVQYGVPSLRAIRRWPSIVTTARSSSG